MGPRRIGNDKNEPTVTDAVNNATEGWEEMTTQETLYIVTTLINVFIIKIWIGIKFLFIAFYFIGV